MTTDRELTLMSSLASRGYREVEQYAGLAVGEWVTGTRRVYDANEPFSRPYRALVDAQVLHIFRKDSDVVLIVQDDDGALKEWSSDSLVYRREKRNDERDPWSS